MNIYMIKSIMWLFAIIIHYCWLNGEDCSEEMKGQPCDEHA
jgi:hypothetical protein